jgi:acyl carrier protein
MSRGAVEESLERLVLEYAESVPPGRPLDARLLLKEDLAIESLSLVSLTVRLGEELGLDVAELGLEFGEMRTFGDLVRVAHTLQSLQVNQPSTGR